MGGRSGHRTYASGNKVAVENSAALGRGPSEAADDAEGESVRMRVSDGSCLQVEMA